MQMTGHRDIPADVDTTWRALNDPAVLQACIPGCESVEPAGKDEWRVVMNSRIGPVSARFTGRLKLADVVAPTACTIEFEGQGGVAGFAKGRAEVRLAGEAATTRMDYDADAHVGGKLAQIGSRLVDGAARKIADDFFARFEERVRVQEGLAATAEPVPGEALEAAPMPAREAVDALVPDSEPRPASLPGDRSVKDNAMGATTAASAQAPAAPTPAPGRAATTPAWSRPGLRVALVGAIVVVLVVYWLARSA